MGDFINSVMIGLISFLVLLSAFWYVVEVGADHEITVEKIESRWGTVGPDSTELQTRILFHNPHRVQIELVRVEYELLINEKRVHWQRELTSIPMPPQTHAPVDVSAPLPGSFALAWITSHAQESEWTQLSVRGMAQFLVSQDPVLVPFEGTSPPWSTNLAKVLANSLTNCAPESSAPCIASATAGWERSRTGVALTALLDVENPTARFQHISNLTIDLGLAGQTIAVAHRADEVTLTPRQTARVAVTFAFDDQGLAAWWPQHVATHERSPMTVDVAFHLAEDRLQPLSSDNESENQTGYQQQSVYQYVSWSRDGAAFQTSFIASQFDHENAETSE